MDYILNLLPSFFAFVIYALDFKFNYTEKHFFEKAKSHAISNLSSNLFDNKNIRIKTKEKEKLKKQLKEWHFNCFKVTLFGAAQLQFLELMLFQCLIFILTWATTGNSAIYLAIILSVAFFCLYLATLLVQENFTWFHPKPLVPNSENSKKRPNQYLERRLTVIVFTAVLLFYGETISLFIQSLLSNPYLTDNIVFLLLVVFVVAFFLYATHQTKKKNK
jgi:hypothetical protein